MHIVLFNKIVRYSRRRRGLGPGREEREEEEERGRGKPGPTPAPCAALSQRGTPAAPLHVHSKCCLPRHVARRGQRGHRVQIKFCRG
jgi:hypothetical protein